MSISTLGAARRLLLPFGLALAVVACDRPEASSQGKDKDGKTQSAQSAAQPAAQPPAQPGGPPPPAVTVSQPLEQNVVEWDEYTARFDAVEMVEVRARISGYLNEVRFKDGQLVQKGDLLFMIDPRPFERALEQARAELEFAKIKAENAARDAERGKPLVDRKIMSEKVYDDRVNAQREAEGQVKIADAKVRTAELELSFTRMAAPIDGRIGRSLVSIGSYVSGGGTGTPTILTTIVRQDPIHLYFDINENAAIRYKRLAEKNGGSGAVKLGAEVLIALPDEEAFNHKGVLDFLDNRLDSGTGTLRARAAIVNPNGLFTPGLFARARIAGSPSYKALLIPDQAIGTDQTAKFVLTVAEDGTVARRPVVLGPLNGGLRIVRSGISAGDWLIVNGLQRARPGAKVTPKREPLKSAASGPAVPAK